MALTLMALIKWFFLILCPLGLHTTRIENVKRRVCNLLLFNAWILFSREMQHKHTTNRVLPLKPYSLFVYPTPRGCILSFLQDTLQHLLYGLHFRTQLALCRLCATCCKALCWSVIVSLPIMSPAQIWQTLQPKVNLALSSINTGAFLVHRQ